VNDIVKTGSSPRRIRLTNLVAALQCLSGSGRMSRAELARRLNLNRSSSGQILSELTDSGLVREVEGIMPPSEGLTRSAGRPGILLELIPDAAFFVGIEIGVEHISAVIIDLTGKARDHSRVAFDAAAVGAEESVRRAFDLVFEGMGVEIMKHCQGVGISAPMHIRPDGIVSLAPLIGWRNIRLIEIAAAAMPLRVPIMIENDANAFAIGDSYKHSQSGITLFLLMETGVGGGILIDGKLFRGAHGLSGEIGHMQVPGSGGITLQELIGREALIKRYQCDASNPNADLQDFLNAVRDREPIAVIIAEDWARHLGVALYQACRLIDPERIVLGGSVAALYQLTAARVALHMNIRQTVAFTAPKIAVDEDAEFGSAFGAACLLHQRFMSLENEFLIADKFNTPRPSPRAEPLIQPAESVT
jgi:predicted NBD/HSP70 family sugar kinase